MYRAMHLAFLYSEYYVNNPILNFSRLSQSSTNVEHRSDSVFSVHYPHETAGVLLFLYNLMQNEITLFLHLECHYDL